MDNSQPAPSILDTLRTVEFRLGLKGYNVDEVDEYLEKAAVEAETLQEQVRAVGERLRQATERIAQLEGERRDGPPVRAEAGPQDPAADESLQRTLLLAQKFVDQARRESEAEAVEVVSHAEERAQATIVQAEERARRMTAEAEEGLRAEVARLESTRGQLAGDVESMARHLESERTRLQGALTEILKWIDENVQPGNSLMALRQRPSSDSPHGGTGSVDDRATATSSTRPADTGPDRGAPDERSAGQTSRHSTDTFGIARAREADTVAQVLDLNGPSGQGDRRRGGYSTEGG